MRWGFLTFLAVGLHVVAAWAQDAGPAMTPSLMGVQGIATGGEVGDDSEDGITVNDPVSETVGDRAMRIGKYRAYSIAGNILLDSSLAFLLTSQTSFVLFVMSGVAGGACGEETPNCDAKNIPMGLWTAFFHAGMASLSVGFPVLYSAVAAGDGVASLMPHTSRRIRRLQFAAWTFYTMSLVHMVGGAIMMPFEATQWISGLVLQPIALAFAIIAVSLNFHAWKLVHRQVRKQVVVPISTKATVAPFISPVQGGMIAGIGGTF